jgi:site-specific DNA-methyltransferase (adenine-specific)
MQKFHDRISLYAGDCLSVLDELPENSIDSVVTDPPYHLTSIVKRFGKPDAAPAQFGTDGAYARASRGFMGKEWDGGDIAFRPELWAKVLRVLKPGGHVLAFSGSRTYHRMACAVEDAGFEIRDQIMWVYGSGFPKSHDVSKGIDKAAGAEREKVAIGNPVKRMIPGADQDANGSWIKNNGREYQPGYEIPATDAARQWQGWGTALKPAHEPIVLARKPLIGTVAQNIVDHGTGAINIEWCRVPTDESITATRNIALGSSSGGVFGAADKPGVYEQHSNGRWPANLIHDGSDEVVDLFPEANDSSAARFFYCAKASKKDRAGSKHPTVKPIALMRYLCRLITPPGGTVLDPFAGSGTTGEAAFLEGFRAALIERETEYLDDIAGRLNALSGQDDDEDDQYDLVKIMESSNV